VTRNKEVSPGVGTRHAGSVRHVGLEVK
jgi:hypothetical protein